MSLLNDSHNELKEAVQNDSLVIFAGAGISKRVGLPLWNDLILKIITNIRINNSAIANTLLQHWNTPLGENKIFEILDLIEKYDFKSFVETTLNDEILKKGAVLISSNTPLTDHSKLWQLSQKIITPNYDLLFESCKEFKILNQQPITNTSIPDLSGINTYKNFLFKVHGSITHPNEIVFYESDYKRQYENDSGPKRALQQLINNQTVLFVGTSMTDPYINELIQNTNAVFRNSGAKSFVLTEEDFRTADIIKISGNPIKELEPLLDELLRYKKTVDKSIPILADPPALNKPEITGNKNKLNLYTKPKQYFTGRDKEIEGFKEAIDAGNTFIAIDGAGGIGKTQFITKCIEKYIPHEKVLWFDCKPESQFDTLIILAGYPELLEGSKTDRDKFSAFKDKLQDNEFFLFLDNFQETNSKPIFKEFLLFIQDYLKKGCVIVIDRDDITTINLLPKRIHIGELKEKKLEYAKSVIAHSYKGLVNIDDAELTRLCDELQGYPLAIDFAILLLSEGEKHSDIISKIVQAEGSEEISERLLNAIFSRPDATQEERDFMMQFSVFTGSVPEQVVKDIIAREIMNIAPKKLKKKNLISFANGYYEMHSLVRAFCYKKLTDKDALHKKVADYYVQQRSDELSPALEERIFYHLAQSKQWEKIENEIEENGKKFILQGQLALVKELIEKLKEIKVEKPIFNIFYGDIAEIHGNWDTAQKYYALAKNQEDNKMIKAEGMIKYAEILHRKGNVKDAFPFYEEAYEFAINIKSLKKEEARAINDLGLVYDFFGDKAKAFVKYDEALTIRRDIKDYEGIATSLSNIGALYFAQGDLAKALEYHEKSLKIQEEIGNKQGNAISLGYIGGIYSTQGDLVKALECQEKSLKIQKEIGNKQGHAISLNNLGRIYDTQGELTKALEYQEKSLKIQEEIGNKEGIASSLGIIGDIYRTQGELTKALEYQDKSLKIYEKIGNKQGIAASLCSIGGVYHEHSELTKALEYQEKSLKIYEEIGNKQGHAISLGYIGSIYITQGDLVKALEYQEKSLKIEENIGSKLGIAASLNHLGAIYADKMKKDYGLAINYFFKSLAISNGIGAKIYSKATTSWINNLREKLGLGEFKKLAQQSLKKLDLEMQKHIPLQELLNEPIHVEKKVGRNELCPCGSGKKYKNCHGK